MVGLRAANLGVGSSTFYSNTKKRLQYIGDKTIATVNKISDT